MEVFKDNAGFRNPAAFAFNFLAFCRGKFRQEFRKVGIASIVPVKLTAFAHHVTGCREHLAVAIIGK